MTVDYGNYGIFLNMGSSGFTSSTVGKGFGGRFYYTSKQEFEGIFCNTVLFFLRQKHPTGFSDNKNINPKNLKPEP